jgi:hypothetical protein
MELIEYRTDIKDNQWEKIEKLELGTIKKILAL